LSKGDEYPAPMRNYWWVRGFNRNQNPGEFEHWGWDYGADVGEPMLAGPTGGLVVKTIRCRKCTPDRPSTVSQGLDIGNTSVLQDEGWGFGYGNFVIIRYLNQQLPASTRGRLAARGLGNHHLYALYGHLNDFFVQPGQQLAGSQPFGSCGNTGNSEASHLHLELRASLNPNDQNFSAMLPTLMDPGVLFLR
jgi:Peptidase family M23